MKRYRLPEGTTPGNIPASILEHRDPPLANTYMALHAVASVEGEWGPFTAAQLADRIPSRDGATTSVQTLDDELHRLAELGYIEVEYLS